MAAKSARVVFLFDFLSSKFNWLMRGGTRHPGSGSEVDHRRGYVHGPCVSADQSMLKQAPTIDGHEKWYSAISSARLQTFGRDMSADSHLEALEVTKTSRTKGSWKGPFNMESDEIAKLQAHVAELQNWKILSGRGMAVGGASTNTSE